MPGTGRRERPTEQERAERGSPPDGASGHGQGQICGEETEVGESPGDPGGGRGGGFGDTCIGGLHGASPGAPERAAKGEAEGGRLWSGRGAGAPWRRGRPATGAGGGDAGQVCGCRRARRSVVDHDPPPPPPYPRLLPLAPSPRLSSPIAPDVPSLRHLPVKVWRERSVA
ncbi:unnamed protein product [Coccothraustes coccothraustes]